MDQGGNELTHEDIWDDSALVDSWNEALDEYKKYHSIHANGGKLEDLPEYQEDANAGHEPEPQSAAPTSDQGQAPADVQAHGEEGSRTHHPQLEATPVVGQNSTGGGPMPPQALLSSMQDEGLKRLLMSWYYAGYYTGLYEGQQQKP